ncbi:hypothetical protein D1J60_34925 (plasmid) [Streptomyces sp. W1SF4]|nr:hypothetical protein D1J60_34925 [Streptomyces sp. W1SF4]
MHRRRPAARRDGGGPRVRRRRLTPSGRAEVTAQWVRTSWTKRSHGAPTATLRNQAPTARPRPTSSWAPHPTTWTNAPPPLTRSAGRLGPESGHPTGSRMSGFNSPVTD